MLHGLGKSLRRQGIEDVGRGEPGAAELTDAVLPLPYDAGDVGVGVDGYLAPGVFREAQVAVAEVEAFWRSVVFDSYAKLGAAP